MGTAFKKVTRNDAQDRTIPTWPFQVAQVGTTANHYHPDLQGDFMDIHIFRHTQMIRFIMVYMCHYNNLVLGYEMLSRPYCKYLKLKCPVAPIGRIGIT